MRVEDEQAARLDHVRAVSAVRRAGAAAQRETQLVPELRGGAQLLDNNNNNYYKYPSPGQTLVHLWASYPQVIHRIYTGCPQVVDILGITCVQPVDNSRVVDKVMHRLSTGFPQVQPKLSTGLSTECG